MICERKCYVSLSGWSTELLVLILIFSLSLSAQQLSRSETVFPLSRTPGAQSKELVAELSADP